MNPTVPGLYRHFKGKYYFVLSRAIVAGTEEGNEPLYTVYYLPLYGKMPMTTREEEEFQKDAYTEHGFMPRFTLIAPWKDEARVGVELLAEIASGIDESTNYTKVVAAGIRSIQKAGTASMKALGELIVSGCFPRQ